MATFVLEVENLGQLSRVMDGLKTLDSDLLIKEQKEMSPFESNFLVKIEMEASYEEVLKNLSAVKNSKLAHETVRPIHWP